MSKTGFCLRVLAAIIVTALATSLIATFSFVFALGSSLANDASLISASGAVLAGAASILVVASGAVIGTAFAIPYAFVMGIFFELPKAFWLRATQSSSRNSIISSALFALLLGWLNSEFTDEPPTPFLDMIGWHFSIVVFMLGGVISANVWWMLFVDKWRQQYHPTTANPPAQP